MAHRIINKKAFTLVEILLVVVIIGVLAAMVVPNIAGKGEQARRKAAKADIEANLATALDMFELDNGHYPTTDEGLKALVVSPSSGSDNWSGPYVKKKAIPQDPWGRPYVYMSPGSHNPEEYDLSSLGSDGAESSDDITNWADQDLE